MKAREIITIFLGGIFLILVLILGGCGGRGGGNSSETGGTISLAWDAPTTNVDGSPLTDLAGYWIYYGTSPGSYTQQTYVGNATTYILNNLTKGQEYYTVVTTIDTSNPPNESGYSNEVSGTAK